MNSDGNSKAQAPGDDGPPASAATSSNRSAILRSGLLLGLLLVVFGLILPRFVNYSDVVAAFRTLTLPQIALMSGLSAVAFVVSGLLFVVVVPGLGVLPRDGRLPDPHWHRDEHPVRPMEPRRDVAGSAGVGLPQSDGALRDRPVRAPELACETAPFRRSSSCC